MTKQRVRLKLKGNILFYSRLSQNGEHAGKESKWIVRERSMLPKTVYFIIHSFVRKRVSECEDKTFVPVRKAVLRALREAGEACGCKLEFGHEGGDICWYLNEEPLIAFQIHEDQLDKDRAKKLRRGAAKLRWAVVIGENGYVRYNPRRSRQDDDS